MKVSSFFQGSALRFSVTGDGVSHDPATGDLTVDTEALAAGITVTVTALDAAGAPGQSFQLTLAAGSSAGEAAAPTLVLPPALSGSGRLGEVLTVAPGTWDGVPAPTLQLQWLRDGAEIAGATGPTYLPQAEDDGRALTCRVTAQNGAGVLAAEPAPVRITRTPPLAIDLLGDVSVFEGSAPVLIEAAGAFSGAGLVFAVAGAGATIDAATGRMTIPTDTVQDGTLVTVTASNSGGTAEATLLVSILLRPFPPLLLAVPALAGTGKVGSPVTVDAGTWSGLPAPTLQLQWLRDGAPIAGATAASYLPTDADDRCALACRVTALNAAGTLAADTAPLAVTQVAPVLVGGILDEVLDLGSGSETIATAQVFQGRGLAYAASGAGATIDAATGVLTLPTDAVRSGEAVTVTATNSGGTASARFLVTIEDPAGVFPLALADGLWSAAEVRDVAPAGRRRVTIDASVVVPAGFELRLYSGPQAGGAIAASNRVMKPGETFTTSGTMAVGNTCYNRLYWRRAADDQWVPASGEVSFPIAGLTPTTSTDFPAANQTLAAATGAALVAALRARIATGSTADWVIHLPAGDYGNVDLSDLKLPGKTTLRSANWPATGAKVRQLTMERAQNLSLEFVLFDRSDLPRADTLSVVNMRGAAYCGISYSEFNCGPNVSKPGRAVSWSHHVNYAIDIWTDNQNNSPHHLTIHMNYIHGGAGWGVWIAGGEYHTVSENVFADIASDDIQLGWVRNSTFRNNWGSRKKYPEYYPDALNGAGDYDHCDFVQTFSKTTDTPGNQYIGNVYMKGAYTISAPAQGLFGNGSHISNHLFENNIILTNTPNALMYAGSTQAYGNRCRYNTVLRLVDDLTFADFKVAQIRMPGAVEISRNVHCSLAGDNSMGLDGLNIVMKTGDYTASRAWYVNPVQAASFYDIRPVEGKATHWAFNGDRQGAFQRFQDVIVGGKYPKIGPAAAAWKTWYDPKNQITA